MVLPALFRSIVTRNSNLTNAFNLLIGGNKLRDPLSLRAAALQLGIGRETLRVAALNNFNFKSQSMTDRVVNALYRINNESVLEQRFTTQFDLVLQGEDALARLRTPLVNGELPTEAKFTTFDPEQQFISDGSAPFFNPYTTTDAVNIGGGLSMAGHARSLGLDPDKVVRVTFR